MASEELSDMMEVWRRTRSDTISGKGLQKL